MTRTPKQKATELVKLLYDPIFDIDNGFNTGQDLKRRLAAKKCALIAVDEILKIPNHLWMTEKQANEFCDYHLSVKQEIEKL